VRLLATVIYTALVVSFVRAVIKVKKGRKR
jgi:hypothetical protein